MFKKFYLENIFHEYIIYVRASIIYSARKWMFYSDVILKTGELEGEVCIKIEGLILRIVVRHPVDFRYSLFELGIGIRIPRCFRIVKYFRGNVFNLRAWNEARIGGI